MYTATLLTIVLIFSFLIKSTNKTNYHRTILAIFGITYFVILKFINFYYFIFPLDESRDIVYLIIITISVSIILSPWARKISSKNSYLLVTIFIVSIIVTFMFEDKIKYTLAQYGHYFDNKPPQELSTPTNKKKFTFINKTIGVKFFIPTTWEEKQNKNGLTYYILKENNQTRIELVPGCFHHSELILPEIIHNIVEQNRLLKYQFKKQCYIGSNGSYVCFIKSSNIKNNKNLTEKWQILIMQSKRKQNIDLKFNFYGKPTVNNKKDIIAIIKSVKILPLPNLIPYCISTEDWF